MSLLLIVLSLKNFPNINLSKSSSPLQGQKLRQSGAGQVARGSRVDLQDLEPAVWAQTRWWPLGGKGAWGFSWCRNQFPATASPPRGKGLPSTVTPASWALLRGKWNCLLHFCPLAPFCSLELPWNSPFSLPHKKSWSYCPYRCHTFTCLYKRSTIQLFSPNGDKVHFHHSDLVRFCYW